MNEISLKQKRKAPSDLPPAVWLGLPGFALAVCLLTPLAGYWPWKLLMTRERGVFELGTVGFLLPAVLLYLWSVYLRMRNPKRESSEDLTS